MFADKELEKVALFYYFTFLDEAKAHGAAIRTIKKLRTMGVAKGDPEAFFVALTHQVAVHEKRDLKSVGLGFYSGFLNLPDKSNWGPWFEFKKVASEKDFQAVIYSKLLKISDTAIAEGLGLPLGTVRYRIGRGLKLLGSIIMGKKAHA